MSSGIELDEDILAPEIIGAFKNLDGRVDRLEASPPVGWKLSRRQKAILWAGVAVLALACVVVPWADGIHSYARGYNFIFLPSRNESRLDTARLTVEIALIVGVTAAGVLSCRPRKAGG